MTACTRFLLIFGHLILIYSVASTSVSGALKALRRLRPSKSVGCNGIPAFSIKSCYDILIIVFKFIVNLNLAQRIFSTLRKQFVVAPIKKKVKTALVNNYRPISIFKSFSKIFKIIDISTFTPF